jgi:hypothetical protein
MVAFMILGCAPNGPNTVTVRYYNLENVQVLVSCWVTPNIGGYRGTIKATAEDGESFQGEWATQSDYSTSFSGGFGNANLFGPGGSSFAWAQSYGYSVSGPSRLNGSFVMTGNKGKVINGMYTVNDSGRIGVAEDNHGGRYRVIGNSTIIIESKGSPCNPH